MSRSSGPSAGITQENGAKGVRIVRSAPMRKTEEMRRTAISVLDGRADHALLSSSVARLTIVEAASSGSCLSWTKCRGILSRS